MRISAVSVSTTNMAKSMQFYRLLGIEFEANQENEEHVENIHQAQETKLMIDTEQMIEQIIGYTPIKSNCSTFAILYDTSEDIDEVCKNLKANQFEIVKEPWDAFWGQRYCVIKDPNGHLVDLYAYLKKD